MPREYPAHEGMPGKVFLMLSCGGAQVIQGGLHYTASWLSLYHSHGIVFYKHAACKCNRLMDLSS